MDSITMYGPFSFRGSDSIFNHIEVNVNGLYIWCVKLEGPRYRAYYVGEGSNIAARLKNHLKLSLAGRYQAHCLEGLRRKESILMHRPGVGMIPRFSHLDREAFNNDFVDNMCIFYGEVPTTGDKAEDTRLRRRYEAGVVRHIENAGLHVLNVGGILNWAGESQSVKFETNKCEIEALSGELVVI